MRMQVVEIADDAVGITLEGRLDTLGVDNVETSFSTEAAAAADRGRHVLVDLSAVAFVGSMGIRMFLTVAKVLARRKQRLVLVGPQPLVREVFDTVALDAIVPVATDRDAALRAARG